MHPTSGMFTWPCCSLSSVVGSCHEGFPPIYHIDRRNCPDPYLYILNMNQNWYTCWSIFIIYLLIHIYNIYIYISHLSYWSIFIYILLYTHQKLGTCCTSHLHHAWIFRVWSLRRVAPGPVQSDSCGDHFFGTFSSWKWRNYPMDLWKINLLTLEITNL